MSASLTDFERTLLVSIWLASALFAALALFAIAILCVRRLLRDRRRRRAEAMKRRFHDLISILLSRPAQPAKALRPDFKPRDIPIFVDIFLEFFRVVRGTNAARIGEIIADWDLEDALCRLAIEGHRGERIETLTVLSYLTSAQSLRVIEECLASKDAYIQLTAIRCIARRKQNNRLGEIIDRINTPEQSNRALLVNVLSPFGTAAVRELQRLVQVAVTDLVRAVALETLIAIKPDEVRLDYARLMESPAPHVRAATVRLFGIVGGDGPGSDREGGDGLGGDGSGGDASVDVLSLGLTDPDAIVRIYAVGAVRQRGGRDYLSTLRTLLGDPVWWVRYRAGSALLESGPNGLALLRSIMVRESLEGYSAREILHEAGAA